MKHLLAEGKTKIKEYKESNLKPTSPPPAPKRRYKPYAEYLKDSLKTPLESIAYLEAAAKDSREAFIVALRNVAKAHLDGGEVG